MTEIEFVGLRSKKLAKLYEQAFWCYLDQLFNKEPNISVVIEFVKNLGADAYCAPLVGGRYPKVFCLEIEKSLDKEETLKAIAHEMVHVRQFRSNQMKYIDDEVWWKGKLYPSRKKLNSVEKYLRSPWELEAYTREIELYNNFVNRR